MTFSVAGVGPDAGTMPKWYEFLRPVLEVLADADQPLPKSVMESKVVESLRLSQSLQNERLPSGQSRAINRIGWATSALRRAKAVRATARATFELTPAGRALLKEHPQMISVRDLEALPAWHEYVPSRGANRSAPATPTDATEQTPLDLIQQGVEAIEDDVRAKLLTSLREGDPLFFEQVVRALLVRMGYGTEAELARLPGAGDAGLDGRIDRDELGLGKIYVQAKRYAEDSVVGRPVVQAFVGALATRGASVGVLFTTSRFSREALDAVERVPQDIALVDGVRLTELMVRHRVGVQIAQRIELVRVDEDFFADS